MYLSSAERMQISAVTMPALADHPSVDIYMYIFFEVRFARGIRTGKLFFFLHSYNSFSGCMYCVFFVGAVIVRSLAPVSAPYGMH